MHRISFLFVLVFALLAGVYFSAEANTSYPSILYSTLNESKDPPLCNNRLDGDLTDFEDVLAGDGLRWKFDINANFSEPSVTLIVDFVCTNLENEKAWPLATHHEAWSCVETGQGVQVHNGMMHFTGQGGLLCSGASVKETVKQLLPHLNVSLPSVLLVTDLFAEALVAPGSGRDCEPTQPIFRNGNIAYSLPIDAQNQTRIKLVNQPDLIAPFVELSSPFTFSTLIHVNSYVEQQSGTFWFKHALNGAPLGSESTAITHPFAMSTTETSLTVGMDKSGAFCGTIQGLLVDPYAAIVTD